MVEQRIVRALQWLKPRTSNTPDKLRTVITALSRGAHADPEVMQRMQLHAPRGLQQRLFARLLALALAETRID